jgi:hypothetical protein
LEANGGDGEESSSEIGSAEEIKESSVLGQFLLDGPGFLDFLEFFGEEGLVIPTATEATKGIEGGFGLAVRDKPSWGIREEWRADREEGGDNEEEGKWDLIAKSAVDGCGVVIDNCSDGRSERDPELEHNETSATEVRGSAFLNVQLGESHEDTTGES